MNNCFVIRNQDGHYWGKKALGWVDGLCPDQVAHWNHLDEAVNTLFELGSKDIDLRGAVKLTAIKKNQPQGLEISELPAPRTNSSPANTNLENDNPTPNSWKRLEDASLEQKS